MVVAAALLAGGVIVVLSVDWYADGAAVPPKPPVIVEPDNVTVVAVRVNNVADPGEDVQVSPGAPIEVAARVATDVETWWWNPSPQRVHPWSLEAMKRYADANKDKPYLGLRVDVLSRSTKGPGYVVASAQAAKRRPDGSEHVSFQAGLDAPQRPGRYELRLIMRQRPVDIYTVQAGEEHVIASRYLVVSPAPAASPTE